MNQQNMWSQNPAYGMSPYYEQMQNARFQTMGGHQSASYGGYSQPSPSAPQPFPRLFLVTAAMSATLGALPILNIEVPP